MATLADHLAWDQALLGRQFPELHLAADQGPIPGGGSISHLLGKGPGYALWVAPRWGLLGVLSHFMGDIADLMINPIGDAMLWVRQ